MILELNRLLSDWFNDPTNGIAAQLAVIPVDVGDTLPTVGTIADETRDPLVAQQRLPSAPGVAVSAEVVTQLDGEIATYTRDGKITMLIRYGVPKTATDDAIQDASYMLRAIVRSLRLFNAASRVRNQIDVYSCLEMSYAPTWKEIGDTIVTGAVRATFQCRDTAP